MRIPALSIIFLFIFAFLIDLYISFDIKQMWKKRGVIIYWISSALCYALLIVTISLPRRDADSGISAVMWLLFTFLTIYVAKALYVICSFFGRLVRLASRIRWNIYPSRWVGLFLGLSVMALMWVGAGYTRHHIMVTREIFYSKNLPESFNGYKIVQLSDLHVGTWGENSEYLQNLVDTVNSLNPDLVVFTGDIVNQKSGELTPFISVLSGIQAKDGVYSILGNHDYGDYVDWHSPADKERNLLRLKDYQRKMGWKMLNNESTYIHNGKDSILLIGVENWGEPPFPKYGDLEYAWPSENREASLQNGSSFKLLLSHNPEHWNQEISKNTNIDLTLSGHTHAMQAMIKIGDWKWSPAKYRYEQWGGRYDRKNSKGEQTSLYVNIGSGAVGMPARLLSAYPEVTLITLRSGDN
ncbi:MAG: metallophosphoesterase [Muribaculaceae bacterium]|nr:metallophosphoesterase [Muribaculaceae bacterium]